MDLVKIIFGTTHFLEVRTKSPTIKLPPYSVTIQ